MTILLSLGSFLYRVSMNLAWCPTGVTYLQWQWFTESSWDLSTTCRHQAYNLVHMSLVCENTVEFFYSLSKNDKQLSCSKRKY